MNKYMILFKHNAVDQPGAMTLIAESFAEAEILFQDNNKNDRWTLIQITLYS